MEKNEFYKVVDNRIKQLKEEGKCFIYDAKNSVAFNSHLNGIGSVLSNMYPCLIKHKCNFDGKERLFNGIDHLFHFLVFEHDEEIRNMILKCNGVRACFDTKEIRHQYRDRRNKKYDNVRDAWNCLYKCMVEKVRSSEDFRKALISTKGKDLVEWEWWSKDLEAGCAKRGDKFYGENWCGRCMMFLRDKVLNGKI